MVSRRIRQNLMCKSGMAYRFSDISDIGEYRLLFFSNKTIPVFFWKFAYPCETRLPGSMTPFYNDVYNKVMNYAQSGMTMTKILRFIFAWRCSDEYSGWNRNLIRRFDHDDVMYCQPAWPYSLAIQLTLLQCIDPVSKLSYWFFKDIFLKANLVKNKISVTNQNSTVKMGFPRKSDEISIPCCARVIPYANFCKMVSMVI